MRNQLKALTILIVMPLLTNCGTRGQLNQMTEPVSIVSDNVSIANKVTPPAPVVDINNPQQVKTALHDLLKQMSLQLNQVKSINPSNGIVTFDVIAFKFLSGMSIRYSSYEMEGSFNPETYSLTISKNRFIGTYTIGGGNH